MVRAHLQGRQIFKFGLLIKKDNKKNLKIRLVFHPNGLRTFSALLFLYTTVGHNLTKPQSEQ
tara:strand:+ start:172 stop:357 length:186 start_codon:yes stop_codon:yes gene_type:complete